MASTREIKERISSIQNTLKITSAMYMISSTKLNNARRSLAATEPYYIALQAMFDRVLRHLPEEFYHPYLDTHNELEGKARRRAIICVTADKGLAGSYNHCSSSAKSDGLISSIKTYRLTSISITRHRNRHWEERDISRAGCWSCTITVRSMMFLSSLPRCRAAWKWRPELCSCCL